MENKIPEFLKQKLIKQYGKELTEKIINGYTSNRPVTLRVNTLKNNIENIKNIFTNLGYKFKEVAWYDKAFIIENVTENEIRQLDIYQNGEIYLQSLSSMMPVIMLEPKENENILDMAAAPGGKTTQICSETGDKAFVTACEKNKIRCERLKYNIEKQGVKRVTVLNQDARDLNDYFSFDKILLDAPCSGSGTLTVDERGVKQKFSKELVTRSAKTQEEMLKKAIKLLKPGHEMVYSTCSILEDENEKSLKKILGKQAEVVPISADALPGVPLLPSKVPGTLCICPDELYEGFFVAKIRKK